MQLTQGVVKNIIPAIPSTNAIVAAACTLEAVKAITMCSAGMNNYMMYVGSEGIYTHTVAYERDPQCPLCSAGVPLSVASDASLQSVMDAMVADARLGPLLSAPSVSYGTSNLFMRGVLEEVRRTRVIETIYTRYRTVDAGQPEQAHWLAGGRRRQHTDGERQKACRALARSLAIYRRDEE